MEKQKIIEKCKILLKVYNKGSLGYMKMPEDTNPGLKKMNLEEKLFYFTLPMSLNYQRNSYKLWDSVLKTYEDKNTKVIFDIEKSANLNELQLKNILLKYRLALQPNKHINTWKTISKTVYENWGSLVHLFEYCEYDFLKLRKIIQKDYKKGFPYISGPKIFNYWCSILPNYTGIELKNKEFIEIAVDTHVLQASIKLGLVNNDERNTISKTEIHIRWKDILQNTGISPYQMHSPLWFWSRNKFIFKI